MTPLRTASLGLVLLASLAAPAAAAAGWTGWSEFYRSFAVEPPPAATPAKVPGIHKVPDVTLKRGITGEPPKTKPAPKPKLGAAPPVPGAVPGWDPLPKKTITGAAPRAPGVTMTAIAMAESRGEQRYHGARSQQGRVQLSALDDLPAAPTPRMAGSSPSTPAAIRRPALDDRKYTDLADDLLKPNGLPANGLAQKPQVHLPGSGTPFSGKYRTAGTTHKLR